MRVEGLEHVNIVAADVGRTARFYEALFGLEARPIPVMPDSPGRWIYDEQDRAIIHVQPHRPERHGPLADAPAATGAIDHVALACTGFEETRARCVALGLEHTISDFSHAGFRQIFVTDPDNVLLELNFREG